MRVQIKKWGNSASVRIPSAIMASAVLEIDQEVDVRNEGGRIIIEPIVKPNFTLDSLLEQITPENLHEVFDWGKPAGRETW